MKNPTNDEVLGLYGALAKFKSHLGIKFNMAICDNLFHLEEVCKPLIEQAKRIQAIIKDYDAERIEKAKAAAKKGEHGEPLIIKGDPENNIPETFDIEPEAQKALEAELKELRETKYKKQFEDHDKEEEDYKKLLEEECKKFKPTMIDRSILPGTLLTHELRSIHKYLVKK